jgi:hypothetical protein
LGRICRYKGAISMEWLQASTHNTTAIRLDDRQNQGVHLVGSERYASST